MPSGICSFRAGFLLSTPSRSEEHTSELQSPCNLVGRLLLEKKNISGESTDPGLFCKMLKECLSNPAYSIRDEVKASCLIKTLGFFFLNDTAPAEIYTLSQPVAFPI